MTEWVLFEGAHRCRAGKCYRAEPLFFVVGGDAIHQLSLFGSGFFSLRRTPWESTNVRGSPTQGCTEERLSLFQSCRVGEGSSPGWVSETKVHIPWVSDDPDSRDPGKWLLDKIRESNGIDSLFLPQSRGTPPLTTTPPQPDQLCATQREGTEA